MEWRFILPVLCLIGLLHVPGNVAQSNSTNSTNNTSPAFTFDIVFSTNLTFIDAYSNMANNTTINLKNSIISQVNQVFGGLKNFQSFDILQFRNGSVVVVGKLYFNNSDSKPNAANLTQLLYSGNFTTFSILINSTTITEFIIPASTPNPSTGNQNTASQTVTNQTVASQTVTNQTVASQTVTNQTVANQTTANQTTTTSAPTGPAKVTQINLVFKILQTYKDNYASLNDPETVQLAANLTNAFTPFYQKRFSKFYRMFFRKFSAGSIVADSVFEFDATNGSTPNVTDAKQAFIDAVANGNFSFSVDTTSINVTVLTSNDTNVTANTTTTTQATTTITASISAFNLTFKMVGNFVSDLSNLSSNVATVLTTAVVTQLNGAFKGFKSYKRSFVRQYRSGSIIVDAGIECDQATSPNATDLAKALAAGVTNGTVNLPIDTTSIKVTDSSGFTANKSPVLASMLTAFWMTLASLLLSAVMH